LKSKNSIKNLFLEGKDRLKDLPMPELDSRLLVMFTTSISEAQFHAYPEQTVSRAVFRRFRRQIAKRLKSFPIAYLLGKKDFWSNSFHINKNVIIPRPETELIVERVIQLSEGEKGLIVDLGTGSGNISLSLAKELPGFEVLATDVSKAALKTAKQNALAMEVENVRFIRGSWFEALKNMGLEGRCDFILSNPPYVAEFEWDALKEEIRSYEPKKAFVSGRTGMEAISILIRKSCEYLKPGGYLIFEIGWGQKHKSMNLFGSGWSRIESAHDLNGIPRIIVARKR
jgi:release factor glutamine methyltransferase